MYFHYHPRGGMKSVNDYYVVQREEMVREQIQRRGITDRKVLDAMRKVPRHLFVHPDIMERAYEDYPLPIGSGQTISQPYIVALMTELLKVEPSSKVLEIGTGCGYQAAVLAEIDATVYTVEIIPDLAEDAKRRLAALGYRNVHAGLANGYNGWEELAPYDRIIVTAAPERIPDCLIEQLGVGGRMVLPLGDFFQDLVLIRKTVHGIDLETICAVRFVPMTGATGGKTR